MCDSAVPGAIWVVNALGVLSLIPVAPGPPLAQTIVPPAIPPGTVTGITFDPATGTLWLTGAFTPFAVGLPPIPVGMFPCGMLPFGPLIPIPACLPPPFIGITVNSAVAPGPIPALTVSNGLMTANLATGACTCPVSPPAPLPTTDIDFADVPFSYGAGCGCGPPTIGSAGGYPVLGNGAFTITGIGFGPGPGVAALALSIAPGPFPLACGCVVNLFPGFLIFLPAVAVGPGGPPPCPGTAAVPVGVPAGPPALVGIPLYFEWVRIPGATPCGFELSDGLEVVVGFP
jgi:hypothetical protein